jgi:hypothetical protein
VTSVSVRCVRHTHPAQHVTVHRSKNMSRAGNNSDNISMAEHLANFRIANNSRLQNNASPRNMQRNGAPIDNVVSQMVKSQAGQSSNTKNYFASSLKKSTSALPLVLNNDLFPHSNTNDPKPNQHHHRDRGNDGTTTFASTHSANHETFPSATENHHRVLDGAVADLSSKMESLVSTVAALGKTIDHLSKSVIKLECEQEIRKTGNCVDTCAKNETATIVNNASTANADNTGQDLVVTKPTVWYDSIENLLCEGGTAVPGGEINPGTQLFVCGDPVSITRDNNQISLTPTKFSKDAPSLYVVTKTGDVDMVKPLNSRPNGTFSVGWDSDDCDVSPKGKEN